jgi:serine/threonine protein kinase
MPLTTGSRLGAYEILGPLGAGGMGEVYHARDSRLGRDVAIKVLPAGFATDPDRLARFEQEARAAAALNHPNILAVHDLGQHNGAPFIVTELLDGMSLREALNGGALPARKSIDYGVAVALGLAAAHDKGIVHRDMKPDNVFITADGRVKILDFGVAKLTQPDVALSGMTVMPTTPGFGAAPQTLSGMVVGTIGYMSPEQVRGGIADPRSDIFSLGVLLHEMLSGRRAFSGDTAADVMSGILREDPPDLSAAERHIPPALARIVSRCLEKSPTARFQSARDLAFALDGLTTSSGSAAAIPASTGRSRGHFVSLAIAVPAVVVVVLAAAGAGWALRPAPADTGAVAKLAIALPPSDEFDNPDMPNLGISPDGRYVAYVSVHDGVPQIILRSIDSTTQQPLPGTEGADTPFFSPDGNTIGFFARGRLRTIAIGSSETKDLAAAPSSRGGWWAEDGFIYYAPSGDTGIMKVPSGGGQASVVTTLDREKGEISHRWPQVLPGGKAMLMAGWTGPARDHRLIQVHRFDTGTNETVATGDMGRYVRSGHVVFGRLDALMAVPFDVERLAVTGVAVRTGETVRIGSEGADYAVSDKGVLVHLPGDAHRMDTRLVWVDRAGHIEPIPTPAQDIANPTVAPVGRRAAFNVHGATNEIAIADLERGTITGLTSNSNGSQSPVWSPDGRRIAYRGTRKGFRNVWAKSVDGTSDEQQLTRGDHVQTPLSWSPDGKFLMYYDVDPVTGFDLWLVSPADGKMQPLVTAPLEQNGGQWSPDGRWIAYSSQESGRNEIFVVPFPLNGQRSRISTAGGSEPLWSPDGRELFYRAAGQIMAVDVRTSPSFSAGTPRTLFPDGFVNGPNGKTGYSIALDGRFLFAQHLQPDPPITHLQVVLNWFTELRRAVAAK